MICCPNCGCNRSIIKTLNDDFEGIYTCEECFNRFTEMKENIMASNTKLSAVQKEILAEMKAEYPHINLVNNGKTTVAYVYVGNTVRFSTSVMSPDEKKFRRKVGEYIALDNLVNNDYYVVLDKHDFEAFLENMLGY